MQLTKWATCLAGVALIMSTAPNAVNMDPAATFTNIRDAAPNRFYDAALSRPDAYNPNRLIIGLNSGLDFRTFKYRNFRASTAAFSYQAAMDTIKFRVDAPAGYYIQTITYTQRGSGSVVRTGKAAGGVHWVVGDYTTDLGQFTTNPNLSWRMDLTQKMLTSVPVSITNSLFAFATPSLGSAVVGITSADVVVTLLPLPLAE